MQQLLNNNRLILMEAAISERLRRSSNIPFHTELAHSLFIYTGEGRKALQELYEEYMDISSEFELPLLLTTPTWKANKERVERYASGLSVNSDSVRFLRAISETRGNSKAVVKVGGLIGCKNDCYQPDEGLTSAEARAFHSWQIDQLAGADSDFLMAATQPAVQEALGISQAMDTTALPYIISFVISRDGIILDGTPLEEAVELIDASTINKPLAYMVNCAYPSFLHPENHAAGLFTRLTGYQANASSLDHCMLEGAKELEMDPVSEWGELMVRLNKQYGVKLLGGCCGTNGDHLRYIADRLSR